VVCGLAIASWLFLAMVLITWALLTASDRWWPATALMYAPRWVLALPSALLFPTAIVFRPRLLAILIPALWLALGPVAGLCVPWRTIFAPKPQGLALRVFSCNIHYKALDPPTLKALLLGADADVFVLQACASNRAMEPVDLEGWHFRRDNELFCASRYPFHLVKVIGEHSAGRKGAVARYDLETPAGLIHLFSLHLATPRNGLSAALAHDPEAVAAVEANSERRRLESENIRRELEQVSGSVLIAGDFNTPTESSIFHRYWGEYADAFSTAGWGFG
jgi:endonuclease/exonuclease/phosphatase family metal-dependent hydrolase